MAWADVRRSWIRRHAREIIITIFSFVGTVVIGGWIIPSAIQQVENTQKELEIKVNLIREMTDAVMDPIGRVMVLEQDFSDNYPKSILSESKNIMMTNERIELVEESRLIEPQLKSYFPGENFSLAQEWNGIAAIAHNFVSLNLVNNTADRKNIISDIYRFFDRNITTIDLLIGGTEVDSERQVCNTSSIELFGKNLTADLSDRTGNRTKYRDAYFDMQGQIKERFDSLSKMILDTRIPQYSPLSSMTDKALKLISTIGYYDIIKFKPTTNEPIKTIQVDFPYNTDISNAMLENVSGIQRNGNLSIVGQTLKYEILDLNIVGQTLKYEIPNASPTGQEIGLAFVNIINPSDGSYPVLVTTRDGLGKIIEGYCSTPVYSINKPLTF